MLFKGNPTIPILIRVCVYVSVDRVRMRVGYYADLLRAHCMESNPTGSSPIPLARFFLSECLRGEQQVQPHYFPPLYRLSDAPCGSSRISCLHEQHRIIILSLGGFFTHELWKRFIRVEDVVITHVSIIIIIKKGFDEQMGFF